MGRKFLLVKYHDGNGEAARVGRQHLRAPRYPLFIFLYTRIHGTCVTIHANRILPLEVVQATRS